jgi:photosystem II stability/assembly factor-like uncharacterized protein
MKKYIAGGYPDIKKVEITRETKSSIWMMVFGTERRSSKLSEYTSVLDTFEGARTWLILKEEDVIASRLKDIQRSKDKIEGYRKLTDKGV